MTHLSTVDKTGCHRCKLNLRSAICVSGNCCPPSYTFTEASPQTPSIQPEHLKCALPLHAKRALPLTQAATTLLCYRLTSSRPGEESIYECVEIKITTNPAMASNQQSLQITLQISKVVGHYGCRGHCWQRPDCKGFFHQDRVPTRTRLRHDLP